MDVKKVRWVAAGGLIVAAGAGLYMLTRPEKASAPPAQTQTETEKLSPAEARREARRKMLEGRRVEAPQLEARPQDATKPLREIDRSVLAYLKDGSPPKGKGNDIFPRGNEKVTVVGGQDMLGHPAARRVEIDLDRDGKTDEVWTVDDKNMQITRRANPIYSQNHHDEDEYVLEGDQWKLIRGKGLTTQPPPVPVELRPMDVQILNVLKQGRNASDAAFDGQPYLVKLNRQADGEPIGVTIDLDRDQKIDERWLIGDDASISRFVAPGGDTQHIERYLLRNGKWLKI